MLSVQLFELGRTRRRLFVFEQRHARLQATSTRRATAQNDSWLLSRRNGGGLLAQFALQAEDSPHLVQYAQGLRAAGLPEAP